MTEKRGIPQEALRFLAMVTMLIDHTGYILFPRVLWLRGIGRLAFPIFAFLLAEGANRTRKPVQYALRLLIAALISEYPFDLMCTGYPSTRYQNVMFTLLFGLLAILAMKQGKGIFGKFLGCLAACVCMVAAERMNTDYGAFGVMVCVMFWLFRKLPFGMTLSTLGFVALCFPFMKAYLPHTRIPIEVLGAASIPLCGLYKGWRMSRNKALQWSFYLYYPVHILILHIISIL